MAETNSENERKELFNELLKSIKEYSKEDITQLKRAKAEIVTLLCSHRPVKLCDYEFGLSQTLKKNQRLIVKEENDATKVREYKGKTQSNKSWQCVYSGSLKVKCSFSSAQFKYGILFASKNHAENCVIKEYSFVQKIQKLLKQGNTSGINRLISGLNTRCKRSARSNQTLLTSMFSESPVSDAENETEFEESNLNDTSASASIALNAISSPRPSSTSDSLATQPFSRPNVKRELENTDYCMILEEPAAKKPKIAPNSEEIFSFDLPSATVLKEKCEKLKIEYNKEAYKFWASIDFDKIVAVADKIQTHEFKSPNIFACLSLFFTGKVTKCYAIQETIYTAFCHELSGSSSLTSVEIDQAFANTTVTDDHLEFIAKFLECRIGIYENGKLKKIGKWETENIVFTLILSLTDQMFCVVLDLE